MMHKTINDSSNDKNIVRYLHKRFKLLAFFGSIYLILIFAITNIINMKMQYNLFLGIAIFIVVAVVLDLIEEGKMILNNADFVKVAEFQDPIKAKLLKGILENKGIDCYLNAYYHRALLYFFGPFIEISMFVAKDKLSDVFSIIREYDSI